MRAALLVLVVFVASPAFADDAPEWNAPCLALFQNAKAELSKLNPIFAKAKVAMDGKWPALDLKKRDKEEYRASVEGGLKGWRSAWHDPGCGEGCPVLISERESLGRRGYYYIQTTEQDERTQNGFGEIMKKTVDACFALPEGGPGFGPGFWQKLVVAGARWELVEYGSPVAENRVIAETYDVRKVGAADVARVRWTFVAKGGKKSDFGNPDLGRYTQLAVTPAGLYLLDADQNDASVSESLAKKPARSDPPVPYAGSARNQGRFLELARTRSAVACMGVGPVGEDGTRKDLGFLCISPEGGIVRLDGKWSPNGNAFINKAFEK
jgi:hypothetical protein